MTRERTVVVCALNIAMHRPHSSQAYVDLLKGAYRKNWLSSQGELHGLLLGSLTVADGASAKNEITGEIYRFVKIDPNDPWFDLRTRKQATETEVEQINIPSHLLAHMQRIPFVFYPTEHELWFIAKDKKANLGPLAAEKFFEELLAATAAELRFPEVSVTALPDKNALKTIFKLPELHKLILDFKRPNPDDAGDMEAIFEERMASQNIRGRREELTAPTGESIKPDAQTRAEARVAARNGKVVGYGKDAEGVKIEASTADHPAKFFVKVRSAIETSMDALRRARADQSL